MRGVSAMSEGDTQGERCCAEEGDTQSPRLTPYSPRSLFREFSHTVSFGMDIGGTLAKVVYFEPDHPADEQAAAVVRAFITNSEHYGLTGKRDGHFEYRCELLGGRLHFIKFLTHRMDAFLQLVKEQGLAKSISHMATTGGGAHKFEEAFFEELHVQLLKGDEMGCLVQGVHFLINTSPRQQLYSLADANFSDKMRRMPVDMRSTSEAGPYLLVNIGSGVSILRVDGPREFRRVGGTSLGGATFLGLARLMTASGTFEEALALAQEGDSTRVDMLVRDIYGGAYEQFNLSATTVASSFGKMAQGSAEDVSKSDLAKAALIMVTNNIGSIVQLHARLEGVTRVIFAGNFLENNDIAMRTLAFALEFWSQGKVLALFLEHIGYSGAVGALISAVGEDLQFSSVAAACPVERE